MIGERESGIAASKGPSFIPEVVAAIKGDDAVETNVLPLPFALSDRFWVKTQSVEKKFTPKFFLKGGCSSTHVNFPTKSPLLALFS